MSPFLGVLAAAILAQAAPLVPPSEAPAPVPEQTSPDAQAPPGAQAPPEVQAPPAAPAEPEPYAPPPPPPPPIEPPAYGYAGMSELSLALGYSPGVFLAGGGFRRFLIDGLAPGVEASVQTGTGATLGLVLGTLRLAPVRTRQLALVVTGRAGRVLLSHHDDGWGAGGGAGLIWFVAPNAGLELGYQILWLLPRSFCADLTACALQGPVIGFRFSF